MSKKTTQEGSFEALIGKLLDDPFIDPSKAGEIEKFPTGSPSLDYELNGGYPKGTIIEATGLPASGKTTAAIHCAAEFQKKYPNEKILWLDLEKVFDNSYNASIGLDTTKNFMLARPKTGEDAWTVMIEFAKNHQGGLIVLDSVTLLLPITEEEGDMGDATMALAARMNSKGQRKFIPHMSKNNTTLFAINQMRSKIGAYGEGLTTTGGNGWAFYARTRLRFYKSAPKDKEDLGEFSETKIKLEKATYGNELKTAETRIIKYEGFDYYGDILNLAVSKQVVNRSGSWFSYMDTKIGQGRDNTVEMLKDNIELFHEIREKVYG